MVEAACLLLLLLLLLFVVMCMLPSESMGCKGVDRMDFGWWVGSDGWMRSRREEG
jgi:hypothetical protein